MYSVSSLGSEKKMVSINLWIVAAPLSSRGSAYIYIKGGGSGIKKIMPSLKIIIK